MKVNRRELMEALYNATKRIIKEENMNGGNSYDEIDTSLQEN